jgi:DNA-directed RNA polymerase specialized sigma24 family protein
MLLEERQTNVMLGRVEWFATTHWSMVLRAKEQESPQSGEALENLCRAYWYPLYAYIRRKGHSPHDAQDLTQEFFARLLRGNFLATIERRKGRFRTFLLASVEHFLAKEWVRANRQKRGGKKVILSLDDQSGEGRYALEPVDPVNAQRLYERRWAMTLLERTME